MPDEAGKFAGVECKTALLDTMQELRQKGFDAGSYFGDSHSMEAADWAWHDMPEGRYDLVFIDGDHSYEGVEKDFLTYGAMGKIIAFHDIVNDGTPGVKQFWDELKTKYPHRTDEIVRSGMGIGILRNGETAGTLLGLMEENAA